MNKNEIIRIALESGFKVGTMYGQDLNKLMPSADGDTLMKFAKAIIQAQEKNES